MVEIFYVRRKGPVKRIGKHPSDNFSKVSLFRLEYVLLHEIIEKYLS